MVPSSEFGRPLPAVLFSWLPGHDLGETPTRAQCFAAGRLTARLHGHAEGWTMPPGADLPGIDSVLMNVPDRLAGEVPGLDPESHSVIRAAMGQIQERYDQVVARGPRIVLHADLHGWNLRWNAGRLAVLDFDDAGWGVPTQDLAIVTPDEDVNEALNLLVQYDVRQLPVIEDGRFVGLLRRVDIIRWMQLHSDMELE